MTISRVAIIGLGLIGGSIGLAVREMLPGVATTGWDADAAVRRRAAERGLAGTICETAGDAVREAELVILCVPVGAMNAAAEAIAAELAEAEQSRPAVTMVTFAPENLLPGTGLRARRRQPGASIRGFRAIASDLFKV